MLEKEVQTDKGVPAKYWRAAQFISSFKDHSLKVEMCGYATEDAVEPIARTVIDIENYTITTATDLEGTIESTEAWQNLK